MPMILHFLKVTIRQTGSRTECEYQNGSFCLFRKISVELKQTHLINLMVNSAVFDSDKD